MIVALGLLLLFTIPVGMFTSKVYECMRPETNKARRVFESYLPVYNVLASREVAYSRTPVVFGWMVTLVILLALFRGVAIVLVTKVPVLVVFSAFGMVLCLILLYLFFVINAVDFCNMLNAGPLCTVLSVVCPPIGYYVLSLKVKPFFYSNKEAITNVFGADNED